MNERRSSQPPPWTGDLEPDGSQVAPAPRRGHFLVLYGLAAIFVAISVWCFVVLGRTVGLRSELSRHMDWLHRVGELRDVLETEPWSRPNRRADVRRQAEGLVIATQKLADQHGSPQLELAAQRLEQRLDELSTLAGLGPGDDTIVTATYDDLEEAAYAVVSVLPELEPQVQQHVVDLYAGLDRLWRSLRALVLMCLLLCASNLGLLYLVHRRRLQLEQAHAHAMALASHDALTGVWNRNAILRILRLELARAERSERPRGVILLDLDDFRRLNVLLGSREADFVLQEVSRRLAAFVRPYDTFGRLGGDSFLAILPSCDQTATAGVAERLHRAISDDEVEHAHGSVRVRISLEHDTILPPKQEDEAVDADQVVLGLQQRLQEQRKRGTDDESR